jgi:hypothetical protein
MPEPSNEHEYEYEHERQDANVSRIVLAAAALAVAVVSVLGVMKLFVPEGPARPAPTAGSPPFAGAGRPALEIAPEKDLAALRAEEDQRLESYSWVDRDRGIVAIPIERAMKLLTERGMQGSAPSSRKDNR